MMYNTKMYMQLLMNVEDNVIEKYIQHYNGSVSQKHNCYHSFAKRPVIHLSTPYTLTGSSMCASNGADP